jgi:hypothetical protein
MRARKLRYLAVFSVVLTSTLLGCQTAPTGATRDQGATGEVGFESGTSLNESIRGILTLPDTSSPVMR